MRFVERSRLDRGLEPLPAESRLTTISGGIAVLGLLAAALGAGLFAFCHSVGVNAGSVDSELTAHEWGTFTSIAGPDGRAAQWIPQDGSTDLPEFVEHLRGASLKPGLRGTIRMETPVLYFYSSRETTVSVRVAFSKGLITEWYPHVSEATPTGNLQNVSLAEGRTQGNISWNSVRLQPGAADDFPWDRAGTHYYAARETSATPLSVKTPSGDQHEKFLFYRGVAAFPVPVSATLTSAGDLLVRNLGAEEIPGIILFERRGERVGYRLSGPLASAETLAPLELSGSVDSLRQGLEEMLVARGLYRDEAHAMIETWRDSWFQEGSRLFYLVPTSFVNTILPLSIDPAPTQTVRVFVGRIEVISPATEREIETALAAHDDATLRRFGRFLNPTLQIMMDQDPKQARRIRQLLDELHQAPEVAQRR
jgi:hypothetical protein